MKPPPSQRYFNRDLSWLEFNRRVLHQALDKDNPLLERLKFLAIFSSNLDEFFMKRVGYLKRLVATRLHRVGPDGIPAAQALALIRRQVKSLLKTHATCYEKEIRPLLRANGISLLEPQQLSTAERQALKRYFHKKVFPVLTPLAVDPAHPFPFLSNLSVSIGIKLHYPKKKEKLFARIKIPDVLPQWIRLNGKSSAPPLRFVRLQDIIELNLRELFPEMVIQSVMSFRITRNASIEQVEEEAEDLLDVVEEELRQRRTAKVVRLEFTRGSDPWIERLLQHELELEPEDFYKVDGELNYPTLQEIYALPFAHLKYPAWSPVVPPSLSEEKADIFRLIRKGDLLVHHPYHSFSATVERFVRAAVEDPDVLAIKMTLYRTDEESPFIPLLIQAAEKGKQVVCVVELKARFDEAQNIYWGELLEKAGVHVVYGIVDLKTHCKAILIVRKEEEDFRFYAHLSTGNYNSETAKLYTDMGLFTRDEKITSELIEIFNYLTGLSLKTNYRRFLVAPINMKERFMEMIRKEMELHRKGEPSHIIAKMNSLEDHRICDLLYEASEAGVEIDLIVRGFCSLVPGIPGQSSRIRVRSIIGRFLEHSRIFYFRSGAKNPVDGRFFIGSADWMYRNLNNRVETAVPIEQRPLKQYCWSVLQAILADTQQAWVLDAQGRYVLVPHRKDTPPLASQEHLMETAQDLFR